MRGASTDEQDTRDMERLVAGQDGALDDLMERHAGRLYHYLLRVVQNETEAADIAQETFVRVYLNRRKFRPKSKFSTWLYTIATNLARDLRRQRARHPHVSMDAEARLSGVDFHEVLAEARPNPGEMLESVERGEAVRLAVAELAEELRTPLVLSVYEEKSHDEIGAILECSAIAVEMRLYRARQQLRERLEKTLALR